MKNPVAFVLLFTGRTGSTYLRQALNAHPEIRMQGEILTGRSAEEQVELTRVAFEVKDVKAASFKIQAAGFKTKFRDILDPAAFQQVLSDGNARIIHMRRKSLLKQAISRLNGQRLNQTYGVYNRRSEDQLLPPFAVDLEELDVALRLFQRDSKLLETFIAAQRSPVLCVWYEDLFENYQAKMKEICDFLEVSSAAPAGSLLKNTPDDLRHVLTNFAEMREYLKRSSFAHLLAELD